LNHRTERHGLDQRTDARAVGSSDQDRKVEIIPPLVRAARDFQRDHRGASVVEYALLLACLALICLAGMTILGGQISNMMATIYSTV
jgi:Flp pilus assembly pilin Flp